MHGMGARAVPAQGSWGGALSTRTRPTSRPTPSKLRARAEAPPTMQAEAGVGVRANPNPAKPPIPTMHAEAGKLNRVLPAGSTDSTTPCKGRRALGV